MPLQLCCAGPLLAGSASGGGRPRGGVSERGGGPDPCREYRVEATGAKISLASAKAALFYFCSLLPADRWPPVLMGRPCVWLFLSVIFLTYHLNIYTTYVRVYTYVFMIMITFEYTNMYKLRKIHQCT